MICGKINCFKLVLIQAFLVSFYCVKLYFKQNIDSGYCCDSWLIYILYTVTPCHLTQCMLYIYTPTTVTPCHITQYIITSIYMYTSYSHTLPFYTTHVCVYDLDFHTSQNSSKLQECPRKLQQIGTNFRQENSNYR